ncbi:ABC transporter substrate-binding protein [Streptomyces sp. NPDC059697]|uniref:ABC transporter substrate-binding protein n=1 Tax=Streptomyces sp. NPDC059697 TaxID=3346912 RepID=UPI0036B155A1
MPASHADALPQHWHDVLPTGPSRRGFLTLAGGGALAALLAACAPGGTDDTSSGTTASASGPARRGGTLRVGTPPPPTAVDPVTAYDGSAIALYQLVAEYLIWLDKDFKLVPRLATKWTSDASARTWTFTLREGVTFSDGAKLDAATVKASFDRLLDPKNKSAALSAFDTVLKAGGVSAKGDSTVVFTLERPFSDFPYLVSAGNYNAVVLKKDYDGDFTQHAVGTGPFTLKSYDVSTGASFIRNPTYWDDPKPYLDGVEVRFYADDQADLVALQGGDIDTQFLSRPALVEPLGKGGGITVDKVRATGVTVLTLRVDKAPFDRKEVRQAVAYALDRPAVREAAGSGLGDLGNDHLLAPLFPAAPTDIPQRAKDRAKVAELLKAAGLDTLRFTLTFDPPNKDYAVTVQSQLKEAGITVDLDQRSSKEFYGGDQAKDTPWLFTTANLVGWAGRAVPSQFIIPMVKSDGVWNGSKYANKTLDAAADAYDAATTDAERRRQAEIIAKALHEDVPIVIAFWSGAARAYNSGRFRGIEAHPSQYVDFTAVSEV